MSRSRFEPVDGLLLLDKPVGLSSNDALMRARRLFNAAKAGHGGTLDPLASGLLPVAFGEATKFINDALEADKTYVATLVFGETRTGGDLEGEITRRRDVRFEPPELDRVLERFTGEIEQVPPMQSALKRDGRPLYDYARAGISVERAARRVRIARIDLLDLKGCVADSIAPAGSVVATIRVTCSKGTYIRTLGEDMGEALGCGAHLGSLRRERVGDMDLARAVGLDTIEACEAPRRHELLLACDSMLESMPLVRLDEGTALRFMQGQRLRLRPTDVSPALRVRVHSAAGLLGTATLENGLLAPLRLVATVPKPSSSRNISTPNSDLFAAQPVAGT